MYHGVLLAIRDDQDNEEPQAGGMQRMKLNLSEAPTFRPSPEEFKDPFAYLSAIREQAEGYGICKVGMLWLSQEIVVSVQPSEMTWRRMAMPGALIVFIQSARSQKAHSSCCR